MSTGQHERMEQVVAALQQRWGVKALRRLEAAALSRSGIPTGYPAFDHLCGTGGLPRGALTCLSGHPTSGMTTLALDMLARVQAEGEVTVYIDVGHTLDPEYAARRGIDLERLLVVWPQPRELGLEIARDILGGGGAGVIIFALGAARSGPAEPRGALTRTLRQLVTVLARSPYALVCLATTSDGLSAAVVSHAAVHLRVERLRWQVQAGRVSGYDVRVTALKNRYGPPGPPATLSITLDSADHERVP